MKELKKIALKITLLLALLTAMNWGYEQFLFESDLAKHSEAGELLYAVRDSAEVLYLGESSDFTIGDEDVDKRSISLFLAEYFPSLKVLSLSKGALHAGNYYDLLNNIPNNSPLKTVVVTLNMRSFGPPWIHSKLESALQKEMVLLKSGPALWNRLMLTFRDYEEKSLEQTLALQKHIWKTEPIPVPADFPYQTVHDWDSSIAYGLWPLANGSTEKAQQSLATHYVKGFAFDIDPANNPRIKDFDKIVALAKARGWNLVLNLMPENFEKAEELLGSPLTNIMEENCRLLKARYGDLEGVILLDNSHIAVNQQFRDQDWTTEHYLEPTRRKIAENIALAIKPYHAKSFVKVVWNPNQAKSHFFNDCEGDLIWSQMQSLDASKAKNGKQSSKFSGESPFGITFTYPIKQLDSAQMDTMLYNCWVYREAADTMMSIAIEASGESYPNHWRKIMLVKHCTQINAWEHITLRIPLWPDLRQADFFKAYPYNKGIHSAWIDDISITFKSKNDSALQVSKGIPSTE